MNLQQFEYVLAVKESGNFSEAAEKCNITQSTLSTMIGRLEDELGILFFDRSTKPVSVTKEGSELIKQIRIIQQEVTLFKEMVYMQKGEMRGNLHIGVIPTIAPYVLPGFLNDFAKEFPYIKFTVTEMTTENILKAIHSRNLDVGILALPVSHPDIREIPIYDESFVLFDMASSFQGKSVNASNIDEHRFWLMEEGHCLSNQIIQICKLDLKRETDGANFHFRAGSIDSLIRFVRQNNGMTLLPELSTLDMSESDKAHLFPFEYPVPVRSVGLVYHKHFVKLPLLEKIKVAIAKHIQPKLKQPEKIKRYNPLD